MKNRILAVSGVFFLLIGSCSAVFAGDVDPREMAIDLAVGGMEEGSRPLSSGGSDDKIPGSGLSPGMDTRVTASAAGTNASAFSPTPGSVTPDSGSGQGTVSEPPPGGTGGTNIVDVGANANLGGNPSVDADVTVDPNAGGGIIESDTTVTGPGDTTTTVGANLDDTTSGLGADTTIETGPSNEGVSEPAGTDSDRSVIEADASVNTAGGSQTVDTDVSIDTSAEGGLVDADATTTADVVDQELTSDAGLQIDMGGSTTLLESTLGNEVGTSTAPPDAEADAGLEADVEGTGSGDDVASDPADGLSATPSL